MAARALGVVTEGLNATTITHICYGNFQRVFDQLIRLPVDMLDLEMANSGYDLLELFQHKKTDKFISMGVLDVHNHSTESVEEIMEGIKKGLMIFSPERLYIKPDCGLKTRTEDETIAKLRSMVTAVEQVRGELGLD